MLCVRLRLGSIEFGSEGPFSCHAQAWQACKHGEPTSSQDVSGSLHVQRAFNMVSEPTQCWTVKELNQQPWGSVEPLGQHPVQKTCFSLSIATLGAMDLTCPFWFDSSFLRGTPAQISVPLSEAGSKFRWTET